MPTHLEKYIDYYKKLDAPGYAVLVTGEWGSGKTYQVKHALDDDEYYYVSLFGLKTAEDIHSSVLAEIVLAKATEKKRNMGNWLAIQLSKGGKISKEVIREIANNKMLSKAADIISRHIIKIDRVVIFDDLERSQLSVKEQLGVINTYVEHHGCCTIVIAHHNKLAEEFIDTKEKVFGQTIEIFPQIEKAFDGFCSTITTKEGRSFVRNHRDVLIGVFKSSGAGSLRILKHVLEDLTRLHDSLDNLHLKHKEAMLDLVQLFAALNIEVRGGNLFEKDLKNRFNMRMNYSFVEYAAGNLNKKKRKKKRLLIADEKYSSIDLENSLLQDVPLIEMLIKGLYDPDHIQDSLNNSPYFLKPDIAPPWRIVSGFDKLEDEVVEAGIEKMQKQYDERKITSSGEMLHIFCLRMMLAEEGIIKDTIEEVVGGFKKYIDDLLAENRLPARELSYDWDEEFDTSYAGYSYWRQETNNKEFQEIWRHLIAAREQALVDTFPQVTKNLLEMMVKDPKAFFENVRATNNGENPYALIPILSHIPAKTFVKTWLQSQKKNWHWISNALKGRYEYRLQNDLKMETDWVLEVNKLLQEEAKKAGGFKGFRIRRTIPRGLGLPTSENT